MTDMTKYKNVSLSKETYKVLEALSKVILPDGRLSISKTIEVLTNEKARKLNGKVKVKRKLKDTFAQLAMVMGISELQQVIPHEILETTAKYINVGTVNQKENFMKQWILMMFLMTLTVIIVLTNGI